MRKKGLIICLIILLSIGVSEGISALAVTMSSITSDSIKQKQDQISKAQEEKKQLQSGVSNLKQIKKELEEQKSNLKKYVRQLDQNLAVIEEKIAELKLQIQEKEAEIALTEAELAAALERETHQKDAMTTRIRLMYEQNDTYITDMLLRATSFGDFLNQADFMERVMVYDKAQWVAYRENRVLIELCKEELELEKEILDTAKANVEIEQENLEQLIEQKQRDITAYETDINNQEKAIREFEEEIQAQNEEIEALELAVAEEKKRIVASNGIVLTYDGGAFHFPVATYTRVSSEYGNRIHPTLKVPQFHNGVDLASPKGTAIYAAYDGIVVAATYSSTMGNYVMIDHGDGLYTIYMHASSLSVKKDEIVARGDKIAAVGSTGRSTGNHLHFSVRKNGEYESPWNYISKK